MSTSEAKATAKVRPSRDASPRDPVAYVWGFRRSRVWLADVGLSRLRAVAGEGHVVGFGVLASGELGVLRCHHDAPKCSTKGPVPEAGRMWGGELERRCRSRRPLFSP